MTNRPDAVSLARLLVVAVGLLGALLLAGGNCGAQPLEKCTADADCQLANQYLRCEVETGLCLCSDDRGCGANETCNSLGRCQAISGCNSNVDCCAGDGDCEHFFCDVTTSQCLSVEECQPDEGELCCTLDSQCPFGHICGAFDQRCIPGCYDDGDCLLGQGCVGVGPNGGVGQCDAERCTANNLCDFGEICNLDTGECVYDTRGPYCSGCTGGVFSDDCGAPGNYCLLDPSDPTGSAEFCGVNCAQDQPCPYGFSCNDVIILPNTLPLCSGAETCVKADPGDETGTCSRHPNETCSVDEDCPEGPPGSNCPRRDVGNCLLDQTQECTEDSECCDDPSACPAGSCVKQQCVGGEGDAFGTCTCTRDLDCPQDECVGADANNDLMGHCRLSGHPCYGDLDCDTIACIDGGCLIGSNCAPANDRTCAELTTGN